MAPRKIEVIQMSIKRGVREGRELKFELTMRARQ